MPTGPTRDVGDSSDFALTTFAPICGGFICAGRSCQNAESEQNGRDLKSVGPTMELPHAVPCSEIAEGRAIAIIMPSTEIADQTRHKPLSSNGLGGNRPKGFVFASACRRLLNGQASLKDYAGQLSQCRLFVSAKVANRTKRTWRLATDYGLTTSHMIVYPPDSSRLSQAATTGPQRCVDAATMGSNA